MQLLKLYISAFKIFNPSPIIEFTGNISLLIGVNGSGKSTILEAIAILFSEVKRYCDDGELTERHFNFTIEYTFTRYKVLDKSTTTMDTIASIHHVILTSSKESGLNYSMAVDEELIKTRPEMLQYLPDNLIFYYAGFSERLEKIVRTTEKERAEQFYKVRNERDLAHLKEYLSKNIFYIRKEHFPLLFLLNYIEKPIILPLTKKQFHLNSINLILKKPDYAGATNNEYQDLYNLRGFLRTYLDNLLRDSQPVELNEETNDPFISIEFYMGIVTALEAIDNLPTEYNLYENQKYLIFHIFNLLFHIGILKEIAISLKDNNGNVCDINDLSEGEQQLITIDAIKQNLCKDNTVLFLDEPDSFLHPQRQREFMPHLMNLFTTDYVQIIATTHSPFVAQSVDISKIILFQANGKVAENIGRVLDYKAITDELFGVRERFSIDIDAKINELRSYRDKIMRDIEVDKEAMKALVKEIDDLGEETSVIVNRELAQLKALKGFQLY